MTEQQLLVKWWSDAWQEGLWAAAWSKALVGVTAQQAAWTPQPGAHSIWQIVMHVIFWREDALRRLATGQTPTDAEVQAGNFPVISDTSEAAWAATVRRFEDSHKRVAAIFADGKSPLERIRYLVPHDCYHFGQIGYLRALQRLPSAE